MHKLHFSIRISAPKEKVWNTMLDDATYRQWTEPFKEGSYFEGSWDKDTKMLFLAPEENGKLSGIVSRVAENNPYEFLSLEHFGIVKDGIEDTTSDEVKQWTGAHENYTFRQTNGTTL